MATAVVQQPGAHPTTFDHLKVKETLSESNNDVKTVLNYYKDPGDGKEPPDAYVGKPETYKLPLASVDVTVNDIRGREGEYSLDKNGFQIHKHTSAEKDFLDDEQVKTNYYAEVEQLLKDATGASRVYIFDHTIRRPPTEAAIETTSNPRREPVMRVHVDQSYPAAENRVRHHFPGEEKLLSTRHQIINVWRPIKPIFKDPLAVADATSVPDSDLVPVGLIYPDRRGETYTVRPNSAHRWHYLHGQTPEEVLLIKCYDSKLDGRARRVPHTAFDNPKYRDWQNRESIEVRTLVFHEDQSAV